MPHPTPYTLITGASGGIGLELARLFAKDNNDLVLVARSEEKLRQLAEELRNTYGIRVEILVKDLSRPEAPEEIQNALEEQGIEVGSLVNNAGFGGFGAFHETDWGKEAMMLDLNVKALTHMSKLFIPGMVKRGQGRIMNVASTAAFMPGPLMAVYYASKAYVLSFSEAKAEELRRTGVTVTALCPGPTSTGFQDAASMQESKLFDRMSVMSAEKVARIGYEGLKKGKRVVVPGLLNKLSVGSIRFTPRRLVTRVVKKMQERK